MLAGVYSGHGCHRHCRHASSVIVDKGWMAMAERVEEPQVGQIEPIGVEHMNPSERHGFSLTHID